MIESKRATILFLSAYYRPEITADTHLDDDLIRCLINQGYRVVVICPTPTRGISELERKEYKTRKNEVFFDGALIIHRFWAPSEKKNVVLRAIRYFYCNFRHYYLASRMKEVDLLYCISTPPTQGVVSALIKSKMRRKFKKNVASVYYLEDVFPDTLVASGLTKKGSLFWKIGRRLENFAYKSASMIVTISAGCSQNIVKKGVEPSKIEIVNNWIDFSNVKYVNRDNNTLFDEYTLEKNKFYVVYAGNLGKAQNIDLILDSSKAFLDEEKIQFVIFGSGGEEERVKERIINERLKNVMILPLQPTSRIAAVYSLGDVDIVSCKKGFGVSALPSKTWSIMATERPVIASFDIDGDLCRLIRDTDSGICADADNLDELIAAIKKIYEMTDEERFLLGKHGREYVIANRDAGSCTRKFESIIRKLINKE